LANLKPQPLDCSLGHVVLHKEPPDEARANVLDRQQQWSHVNSQVFIVAVRRLETE
jgi:hypothetical protein